MLERRVRATKYSVYLNPAKPLKIRENRRTKEPKLRKILSQHRDDRFGIAQYLKLTYVL